MTKVTTTYIWPGPKPFGMTEEERKALESEKFVAVPTQEPPVGSGTYAVADTFYNFRDGSYVVAKTFSKEDFNRVHAVYKLVQGKSHLVQMWGAWPTQYTISEKVLYSGPDLHRVYPKIRKPADIAHVIFQIALGLQNLHSLSIWGQWGQMPVAHIDLKPANIFVTDSGAEGGYHCDIGDYSDILDVNPICTPGYESPMYALYKKGNEDYVNFARRHGQKHDMYALGLISVVLLCGRTHRGGAAPLDYLKDSADRLNVISSLTQEKLDQQVEQAKMGTDPELEPLWKMVQEDLLRVNPAEIKSASDIVNKMDAVARSACRLNVIEDYDLVRSMSQLKMVDFIWPSDPPFNWSSQEKAKIELQIKKAISENQSHTTIKHTVPGVEYRYEMFYDGKNVFLNTAEVSNRGKRSVDNKCYNPIDGKYYTLKVYNSSEFRHIQWYYKELKKQINSVRYVYSDGACRVIVPFYPTTLAGLLKDRKLEAKLDAMRQIAQCVGGLHAHNHVNRWYGCDLEGPLTHRNLNPERIYSDGEVFDVDCSEIGFLDEVGDKAYLSPEEARLKQSDHYITFAHEHGRELDIWKLGLLYRQILNNSDTTLSCMDRIGAITQAELDQLIGGDASPAWQLVRKMLRVDPKERCTIHDVLNSPCLLK